MNDLVSEYQQYQDATAEGKHNVAFPLMIMTLIASLQKKARVAKKKANTKVPNSAGNNCVSTSSSSFGHSLSLSLVVFFSHCPLSCLLSFVYNVLCLQLDEQEELKHQPDEQKSSTLSNPSVVLQKIIGFPLPDELRDQVVRRQ